MEITPRPIAMASRARAAFPVRDREVTYLTVSRPKRLRLLCPGLGVRAALRIVLGAYRLCQDALWRGVRRA